MVHAHSTDDKKNLLQSHGTNYIHVILEPQEKKSPCISQVRTATHGGHADRKLDGQEGGGACSSARNPLWNRPIQANEAIMVWGFVCWLVGWFWFWFFRKALGGRERDRDRDRQTDRGQKRKKEEKK